MPSTPVITRLVLPSLTLLLACAGGPSQDFEAELDRLVAEFASAVEDVTALEALEDRIEDPEDRIADHRRENRSPLPEEEYDRLDRLGNEVDALEDVARTVGRLSNSADVSVEDFELVNRRSGLEWAVVYEDDSGLEVVRIDVGSFRSFLVHNPTSRRPTSVPALSLPPGSPAPARGARHCWTLRTLRGWSVRRPGP